MLESTVQPLVKGGVDIAHLLRVVSHDRRPSAPLIEFRWTMKEETKGTFLRKYLTTLLNKLMSAEEYWYSRNYSETTQNIRDATSQLIDELLWLFYPNEVVKMNNESQLEPERGAVKKIVDHSYRFTIKDFMLDRTDPDSLVGMRLTIEEILSGDSIVLDVFAHDYSDYGAHFEEHNGTHPGEFTQNTIGKTNGKREGTHNTLAAQENGRKTFVSSGVRIEYKPRNGQGVSYEIQKVDGGDGTLGKPVEFSIVCPQNKDFSERFSFDTKPGDSLGNFLQAMRYIQEAPESSTR